ncbi:MAG: hypothetical protein ACRC3K_11475, partial [Plesiomonas sp.]
GMHRHCFFCGLYPKFATLKLSIELIKKSATLPCCIAQEMQKVGVRDKVFVCCKIRDKRLKING